MISIIVAVAKNGVIGKKGEIPWYLPADLKHFAKITKGHKVVMGRKTYDSIIKRLGHPLPERQNFVLTSQINFDAPNCVVFHSSDEVLKNISKGEEVFVIGGSEIYKQFLPLAEKLYITEIEMEADGDIFFHTYNKGDWIIISSEPHLKDEKNQYDFTFLELERK